MRFMWSDVDSDEGLGRRVLAYARNLAPCLDSLEGDDWEDALAVLRSVAKVTAGRVSGLKGKAVGDWSWSFFTDTEMGSVFGPDDRSTLARLCGLTVTVGRGPAGSFPVPDAAWRP